MTTTSVKQTRSRRATLPTDEEMAAMHSAAHERWQAVPAEVRAEIVASLPTRSGRPADPEHSTFDLFRCLARLARVQDPAAAARSCDTGSRGAGPDRLQLAAGERPD